MLADIWDLGSWNWEAWGPAACGLLATVLVLVLGALMLRRRRKLVHFSRRVSSRAPVEPEEDPFVHGSAMERRQSLRRGGNPVSVRLSDAEQKTKPFEGWVVDRSTGGLCLSVREPIEPGTVLSVRTSTAPDSVPWVQIEVKNCRQAAVGWELGCQFLRTPPWGVLLLFG